jgi:isopentenyldiphosphate isomerase
MKMKAYPGHWDISSAGHIPSGETSLMAAMREVKEELGLMLPESDFELIFQSREGFSTNNGTYVVNEHQDVYLVRKDVLITDIVLEPSEVDEVKWVSLDVFEQMAREGDSELVPHPVEYPRLIQYLSEESSRL